MRLIIKTTPNTVPIPFDYQSKMVGTLHKWIGKDNDLHDNLSLYSFSFLHNTERRGNALACPKGSYFFISFYDEFVAKSVCGSILEMPEMFCGITATDIVIEATPDLTERELFRLASPVFVKRKNPHLFEERFAENLSMQHLDAQTFQYCKNILSVIKPNHYWLQMSNEEILISSHLAKRDDDTGELKLKNAVLILFGKEDSLVELMPRYRFEAMFHLCTYQQYKDLAQFPNRYDDRITLHCNLINVYDRLSKFVERYLPDRFYLPEGSLHREDLRWKLFREIVANLCVHSDYSSGYACFLHIFKDRVITKNPTRLLPEIPEGELKISQLQNYTKNPLVVRIFRELAWVEDMGSGMRNILKFAPLYYPEYQVDINSSFQFVFSVTYNEMSETNVHNSEEMSITDPENVRDR